MTLPIGKYSSEKVQDLGVHWAKLVESQHPGICFAAPAGLEPASTEKDDPEISKAVDLGGG